jgi:ribosomal protein S18 acetylase RimI-like enzyme
VRIATAEDAVGIARVRKRSWSEAYGHVFSREQLDSISEEDDAVRWRRFLTDRPARAAAFVATRNGRVVGFSSVGTARPGDDPELGELFTIYVDPDEWGQGMGRSLMAAAVERLRGEGFAEAVLWVLEDNPRTRSFYELSGWLADGGTAKEDWLGSSVREVRYRISL